MIKPISGAPASVSAPNVRKELATSSKGDFTFARKAAGELNSGEVRIVLKTEPNIALGIR